MGLRGYMCVLASAAVVVASGCSARQGAATVSQPPGQADGSAAAGSLPAEPQQPAGAANIDLTSSGHRARLQTLTSERASSERASGYRIGPDDLLQIRIPDLLVAQGAMTASSAARSGASIPLVAEAPVFQDGFRVDARGEVTLPHLGAIPAQGKTATELERDITGRLVKAGILRNPQVSVQIAEHRSDVVAVVGSVERPGLYPLTRPGATLTDLVWAAGGPSKDAGRVVEFAPGEDGRGGGKGTHGGSTTTDGRRPVRFDLESLLHGSSDTARAMNPQVRPGDVIKILPAGSVLVDGWVDKPGSYPITRGLTLSGAVAAAGGHLFAADRRRATIARMLGPGEHQSITVDLEAVAQGRTADVPIADGDVVTLPAAPTRLVPWAMWSVAREMVHIGGSVLLF